MASKEYMQQQNLPPFAVSGQFMMTSQEKFVRSEDFNPRKIVALTLDDSLARLFECLTLEYSGNILLTPKWKNFRSQNLKFTEKTRINNAIWRSWHIQFKNCQKPLFCQFGNPLTEMAKPPKPVTLMVEGQYWKRKLEVVAAEYKKWRVFYKHLVEDQFQDLELQHQSEEILRLDQEIQQSLRTRQKERRDIIEIEDVGNNVPCSNSSVALVVSQALEVVDSCNLTETMVSSLPDTLFTSFTGQKIREFSDISDIMQPTLDTLQPSLEAMTPVLDELIEQLEASEELIWDFGSLDHRSTGSDNIMGTVQSNNVEHMDHSGIYSDQYRDTISSQSSNIPIQSTSNIPAHTTGAAENTSTAPTGAEVPGIFFRSARGRVKRFNDVAPVDRGVSSGTMSIDIPNVPASVDIKQTAAFARLRYSSPAGSIPRNSSDSQLYSMSSAVAAASSTSQAPIPIEVQAPNLVAQLRMTKPHYPVIAEDKPKRSRIPRNKSAPGLASLDSGAQLKKVSQTGSSRGKRLGRIPRNRSDSSLTALMNHSEQTTSRPRRGSESQNTSEWSPSSSSSKSSPNTTIKSPPGTSPRQSMVAGNSTVTTSAETGVPAHLINEMVKHLLNKGISLGDILGKLTSLVAASFPEHQPTAQEFHQQVNQPAQPVSQPVQQVLCSVQQPVFSSTQPVPHVTPVSQPVPRVLRPVQQASQPVLPVSQPTLPISQSVHQILRPVQQVTQPVSQPVLPVSQSFHQLLRPVQQVTQPVLPVSQPILPVSQPVLPVSQPVLHAPQAVQHVVQPVSQFPPQSVQQTVQSSPILQTSNTTVPVGAMSQSLTSGTPSGRGCRKSTGRRTNSRGKTDDTVMIDDSLRPTSELLQNLLSQTASPLRPPGIQPSAQLTTIDPSVMNRGSTSTSSTPPWAHLTNTLGESSSMGALSTADVMDTGFVTSSLSGLTSSMLQSTPPVMTPTVGQATSSSRTTSTTNTPNTSNVAETPVRSRPLTKTLPKEQYMEHRRMVHVSAEQKRRGNIKMGFDQLIYMVPSLASQSSHKISKASILKQAVDYILQVQLERDEMISEVERLQREIDVLQRDISICQQLLPASGVSVDTNINQLEFLFNQYIVERTQENPKFWIFNVIFRPLFDAYSSAVSNANNDDFFRIVLTWFREYCSLPKLRPSVLTSLRELIKSTSILTSPSQFPREAIQAANALQPTKIDLTPR